ncbi:MAG: hypothetical protein JW776_16420 [Candidatus Lokiarchaeota archaeon]|nr:hypothetical protein [Candidatus Lokiarchaeota archaeon]
MTLLEFLDFTNEEIILLVLEGIFLFLWCLNIIHFSRRRKKDKSKVVLYILLTSIFYACAVIQAVDIVGLDQWSEPKYGFKLSAGYGAAVVFSTFASYFFYAFGLEVFGKKPKKAMRNKFIFGLFDFPAGILVFLGKIMRPYWTQMVFGIMPLFDVLFFLGFGIHFVASLFLGIFLFINTSKLAKYSDERIDRVSFRLMSLSGVSIVVSYLLWILEGGIFSPTEVSVWGLAGWAFAILISFFMYLGYAQPKFFRDWFKEREIHIRT